MSHYSKKRKPFTKKKKTIIGVALAVVLAGSIWGFVTLYQDEEKTPNKQTDVLTDSKTNIGTEDMEDKKFTKLLDLTYEVLRADSIKHQKDTAFYMDIQVEKAFSNEELNTLGKEVFTILKKDLKDGETVSTIDIQVFTNKNAYEQTRTKAYDGKHVEGLAQSYSSTYYDGSKATLLNYLSYKADTDLEAMDVSLDFEVVNANRSIDNKLVDADVVISKATSEQAQDMIQAIISMIKESNEGVEDVSLKLYESKENYEKNKFSYQFSYDEPILLIQQSHTNFE